MPARCIVRGSINVDEFFQVKDIVRPGETISSDNLVKRLGGKGANQSVAVARAGGIVELVGAVGQDGVWVRDELNETGVGVGAVSITEVCKRKGLRLASSASLQENTGRAIIQVTDLGENSIILFKGANYASLPPYTVPPDTTHIVLQNEIPLQSTIEYLARGSSSGISAIFNPSPMLAPEQLKTFPWNQVTWLIVNSGEALDLCKALNLKVGAASPSASTVDTAKPLVTLLSISMPTTNVVCTLGADGLLAQFAQFNQSEPLYLPASTLQGTTCDTTGAGDCFTGYMVAGLMRLEKQPTSDDYVAVLKRAVQAAGMCVESRGAAASIPLDADVTARLNSAL
ncbi:Ribokinase-like protein [Mycena metata]|uniref:Ribokinase n=1 Tax=Mycena metata TaxID=1033252 RepID=A0AAD7K6A8_9AGAR|nr:Ribokinase-like protein [Mycena metata]